MFLSRQFSGRTHHFKDPNQHVYLLHSLAGLFEPCGSSWGIVNTAPWRRWLKSKWRRSWTLQTQLRLRRGQSFTVSEFTAVSVRRTRCRTPFIVCLFYVPSSLMTHLEQNMTANLQPDNARGTVMGLGGVLTQLPLSFGLIVSPGERFDEGAAPQFNE